MIMTSATGSAAGAVERLHAAREQARCQRAAVRQVIERLRQRNREESDALAARGVPVRRQPPGWPGHPPPEPDRYGVHDPEPPPAAAPVRMSRPGRGQPSEDGWPPESWLL